MGDHEKKQDRGFDRAAVEREIRASRKFSIAEALGRLGGKGLTKGASPVTRKRQAELEMRHALREYLPDAEGTLRVVLLRRVTESEALLECGYRNPMVALGAYIERLLGSDAALKALVHEADREWGRANDRRPHFKREGRPPHPDDPYTRESVHALLTRLRKKLPEG